LEGEPGKKSMSEMENWSWTDSQELSWDLRLSFANRLRALKMLQSFSEGMLEANSLW
jgi:hypothetical protein